jgi:hypothetical protein
MPTKLNPGPFDCMAAALPDEEYMVFLARDPLAPWVLAIWASARVGNLDVALKNFQLMFTGGLLEHFKKHPDNNKSIEAIQIAERMRAWRERNLMPGLTPTWKRSPTERHKQRPVEPEAAKIACGLRQITESMSSDTLAGNRTVQDWQDRINGFAAELELIAGHPLIVVEPLQLEKK